MCRCAMPLDGLTPEQLKVLSLDELRVIAWRKRFLDNARPAQVPPVGDWSVFGFVGGRGSGKSFAGTNWIGYEALTRPGIIGHVIAPTWSDAQFVCYEGPAGLINQIPPELIDDYNRSDLVLTFKNGSMLRAFSAEKPDRLRGPQCHVALCFIGSTKIAMADGSERRIDRVRVGDMVMTRHGARRVTAAGSSNNTAPLLSINDGATRLTGTVDHPILVGDHWVPMGNLQAGDLLWQRSDTMAWRGGAALTAITSKAKGIGASICTAMFGQSTTARFPSIIMSITKMKTHQITTSPIWNACREATTSAIILPARNAARRLCKKVQHPSKMLGRKLRIATSSVRSAAAYLKRATMATAQSFAASFALIAPAMLSSRQNLAYASSAGQTTSQRGASSFIAQSDATTKQWSRALMSNARLLAGNAARRLFPNAQTHDSADARVLLFSTVKIKGVKRSVKLEPVYNLTVEDNHEFIANGIVVHNCDELGAWQRAQDTWDMMTMGLRLGTQTKVMFATTPKPTELMINLLKRAEKDKSVVVHRGTSYDNKDNLAPSFFAELERYSGTKIFQQEVMGEMIDPEESGIIKRSWIKVWPASKALPKFEHVLLSLDTAFTERTLDNKTNDPDYTACSCYGVFNNNDTKRLEVILLDAWQDRLGLPDLVSKVKEELQYRYGEVDKPMIAPLIGSQLPELGGRRVDTIVIEDIGAGKSLRQYLAQAGVPAYAYNPGKADKLARLHLASPFFKQGQVWMPESDKRPGQLRSWCEDLVSQLCAFPNVKHDDLMDTATQALRVLSDMNLLRSTKPVERFVDEMPETKRRLRYAGGPVYG